MSDEYVENLKKPSAWLRVLFMAGFVLALYVAGVILLVLMLAQILFSLITGEDNANLRRLGASLTLYVAQILQFLTYNREEKPFPFAQFSLSNEDEAGDVTAADSAAAAQPESPAPAADSETTAESAAQVMAESAARRATRSTCKTPKANAGTDKTTAKKSSGKKSSGKKTATPGTPGKKTSAAAGPAADGGSAAGPEMAVTDVVDRQAKDV